ncbi:MAG: type IIL restriction-modification enzyme MmeI [Candidatus Kapaibacterium sp.]|nr:class I SAM-dependent DNA methyltransferase [Ignavibacteria bacterium]
MTPQEFVHKWKKSTLTERSASQQHFLDLCALVGHDTPATLDATGESFTFEKGAEKTIGNKGFADVWKRGFFGWEYKGKHKDLEAAYTQLLNYREALQNPPLLVVSDMEQILIHTNFTNTVKRVVTLSYDDLLTPDGMRQLKAIFYEPESFKSEKTTDAVTAEAAVQFAKLSEALRTSGAEPHDAAHFLIRLLFCLFAEDVGLLPNDTLMTLIQRTKRNPEEFSERLSVLFGLMATGGMFGFTRIPHFNGSLFDDATVLPLDRDGLDIVEKVSLMDWGQIEPSIFGTLFERSLDPAKRSQLGAHYTSKEDILLIVEPVLMRPLRRRWDEVQKQAEELVRLREEADTDKKKSNQQDKIRVLLLKFSEEIASIQVLDPACGSGNFLYMALRQLLDLEKEVIQYGGTVGLPTFLPSVNPSQLHGIEINPYAHELASATIWIGYIQWLRDNGFGFPAEPILRRLDTIENRDAILSFDEEGKPYEPEWPKVDVIIGNPPFLGDKKMKSELGEPYVKAIRSLYKGRVPGGADLVCYWFDKAREMMEAGKVKRVGFISTNSIRMGKNREVLDKITETGKIFEAWSDREWVLDGAAVRVSIVEFDSGSESERQLDGKQVERINTDLTSRVDLTIAESLSENEGLAFLGMMKAGAFDITADEAEEMLQAKGNPNGRPNSDVVRPRIGGRDITTRESGNYVIDFGLLSLEEAAEYSVPFEYVKKHVKPTRDTNNRKSLRERWWRFGEARPGLRKALEGLERCIVTPEVAKHRLFVWMPTSTVPDHKLHVITRNDDYFFGVLQSRPHELWSLGVGSRMGVGNDPIYNSGRIMSTFPFPYPPGKEPQDSPIVQAIADAAKKLVEKRDRWLNPEGATEAELKKHTLTNLYNERPTWLDLAHKKLDNAVFDTYGWPHDLSEEQILERLLALNLERGKE